MKNNRKYMIEFNDRYDFDNQIIQSNWFDTEQEARNWLKTLDFINTQKVVVWLMSSEFDESGDYTDIDFEEDLTDKTIIGDTKMQNLKEQLLKRIDHDSQELENKYLAMEKKEICDKAYIIATQQEFEGALRWWLEDYYEDDADITNKHYDLLLNIDENIFEFLRGEWFCFNHPERFNFFTDYHEVLEVVNIILERLKNDKEQENE